MAQDQKAANAPSAPAVPAPAEQTITVTLSALEKMVAAQVAAQLAGIMTAKSPDEMIQSQMDLARGKGRPLPPETMIRCKSPLTGATFTARVVTSKQFQRGRVLEMLDYVRPEGWDKRKAAGGLYHDGDSWPLVDEENGEPHLKFRMWAFDTFWRRDWNEVNGQTQSYAEQWRAPADQAAE